MGSTSWSTLYSKTVPWERLTDLIQRSILIGENEEPLIADSGLDFLIRSSERYRKIEVTCRWEAPEQLLPADDMATPVPTAASDIYAFAMTVQEVCQLF
jgi:Protein tyrosine and serine/threonine kinase